MNFLGGFTPAQLFATIQTSVQTTGNLLWPLFVFVGLLTAFYIAERVGDFVRAAVADRSFRVFGFYVRDVPYRGYNRFRSQQWNLEHMPTVEDTSKTERDNFVEAVDIYNKAHP